MCVNEQNFLPLSA